MARKGGRPVRRVPQRTCIACRSVLDKRELTRLVRTPDAGVQLDPTGKRPGRGAYIHKASACWTRASERDWAMVAKALKTTLTADDRQRLASFAENLAITADQAL